MIAVVRDTNESDLTEKFLVININPIGIVAAKDAATQFFFPWHRVLELSGNQREMDDVAMRLGSAGQAI